MEPPKGILPADLSLELGLPANLAEVGNTASDKVRLSTGRTRMSLFFAPFTPFSAGHRPRHTPNTPGFIP